LRVYDSEHSLAAMGGYRTMEEYRIGVVDNLCKNKAFAVDARGKWSVLSSVARAETGRLRNCVRICTPHEFDSITD